MNRTLLNTKRTWLMLVVLLGVSLQNAFAQVSAYTFAASTGTYTPITGGTPMVLLPAATGPFGSFTIFNNDVNGANTTNTGFPIGFTFKYNNTDFTNFAISANGFIRLGTGTFASSSTTLPISSTLTTTPNIIAPMAVTTNVGVRATASVTAGIADIVVVSAAGIEVGARVFGTGVPVGATVTAIAGTTITLSAAATTTSAAALLSFTGEIRYETSGIAPNRRLTVQWKNCARNTTAPAELINHQLILEETTNNVVFKYGDIGITLSTTAQVGLKGFNETDFNNRTTTTDWAATTAGATAAANCTLNATIKPAIGQVYTFSPNATACIAPGGVNVTNLNSTSVTLNWASTPLATAYNVEYRLSSTAPAGAFTVATGSPFAGTTASVTGLNLSTAYQWRVQSVCAGPTTSTFLPAFFQDAFTTLSACAAPNTLVTSAITTSGATLSWVGNLTATNYNLEYRQVGTIPYTSVAVAGTTSTLTGLLVGTSYEWRVTSNCAGAVPTAVSTQVAFTTVCTVSSLPFNESFEGITTTNQIPACMAVSSTSICLTNIATVTFGNRIPRTGTKSASFRWGTAATGDYFYTVPLQMTAGTVYQFSTWYTTDGNANWGTLDAWVGPNQSPTGLVAIPGASVTGPSLLTYSELAGTFTVPTTGIYYVALRCVTPSFSPNYLTFDDMFVGLPPACIVPSGITASTLGNTTATVSWNAVTGSTGYNVQYRVVGAPTFTPFAGNPVTVGTSANLTGLVASSNYEVQVQNICSAVLSSTYSFSSNFATTCAPVNVFPYFEGFEGITAANQFPNCMAKTARTFTEIAPASFNRAPRTGTKYGYFQWGSTTGGDYIYSAPLALIAGKTYDFSVWYSADGAAGWTNLDAWVGPNQNPTGLIAIAGASATNIINTAYQQLAGSFIPTTTGTYYVALRAVGNGTPWYLSFDDFSVVSPCVGAVFTTLTLPAGTTSAAYNETITATGGVAPYTFTVTAGALPAGLTLNATTGVISGTPTVISITPPNFTLTISDATSCTTNKTYSIVVTGIPCTPISITPTTVPAATLGVLYTPNAVQFVASGVAGATYAYNVVSGVLPSGMSLSSSTGNLVGTPNSVPVSPTITVRARITTGPSAGCFGIVTLDLVVNCPVMTFAPATISDAVVNLQYSQQFTATYGTTTPPTTTGFTFTTTSTLPLGFTLSTAGVLSGTSATLSTPTSITIKATRSNGCNVSQIYTFGVVPTIAAPTVLKPIQISSSSFRARWTPVQRATKYRLYIATSPNFDGGTFAIGYVGLEVVGDTSILIQNLKPETKYYIQVTAISSADEVSPYSNIENGTTLSAVTGIDNALSSQVKVSPNPSNDKFSVDFGTLNLGKTTARVYDAQGKQVLCSEINGNQTTISLGNMANGIYLLEITSNKGRILKRLIKE